MVEEQQGGSELKPPQWSSLKEKIVGEIGNKIEYIRDYIISKKADTSSLKLTGEKINLELKEKSLKEKSQRFNIDVINPGDPMCKHDLRIVKTYVRKFSGDTAEFTIVSGCSKCDYQDSSVSRGNY